MRPCLTEWKIATEYGHSRGTKRLRKGFQQGSLAVGAGAVSQNQAIRSGWTGQMQEPPHGRVRY